MPTDLLYLWYCCLKDKIFNSRRQETHSGDHDNQQVTSGQFCTSLKKVKLNSYVHYASALKAVRAYH